MLSRRKEIRETRKHRAASHVDRPNLCCGVNQMSATVSTALALPQRPADSAYRTRSNPTIVAATAATGTSMNSLR
jgi:hypothetical protein